MDSNSSQLVLFTDLDRTVLYNSEFVDLSIPNLELEQVDVGINSKRDLFMTRRAYNLFTKLMLSRSVVPVTARSLSSFNNLSLAYHLKDLIFCNGGGIIVNGLVDQDWSKQIISELKALTYPVTDFTHDVLGLLPKDALEKVDYTSNQNTKFLYPVIYFQPQFYTEINDVMLGLDPRVSTEYTITIEGEHKLYLMPKVINKTRAIKHFLSLVGTDCYVAAGDSLMDLDFLAASTHALVSLNGGIADLESQTVQDVLYRCLSIQEFGGHGVETSHEILEAYSMIVEGSTINL
jgi:hydroxymethylpyrimidine pyrophosphatase-like HAD family hydrolase